MSFPHHIFEIQMIAGGMFRPEKIVEDPQPFHCIQFRAPRPQASIVGGIFCPHSGEIVSGFLDILFYHGSCDEFLLHQPMTAHGLVHEHLVDLLSIHVQAVSTQGQKNGLLIAFSIDGVVGNCDFGSGFAVQSIQQI